MAQHGMAQHSTNVGHVCLQDMASWTRDGIAGLQSVVLYSLPELDGAIDTVPLGGLVGDNIFLVNERVTRLSQRIKKWVHLRKAPVQVKDITDNTQFHWMTDGPGCIS